MLSGLVLSLPSIQVRHIKSSVTLKGFFSPPHFYLMREDHLIAASHNLLSSRELYRPIFKCVWS